LTNEGSGFGEFRRIPRSLLRGASINVHDIFENSPIVPIRILRRNT
jgi:hypothetical protein